VADFSCPNCQDEIHPEDALLKYFSEVPTTEVPGRPCKIGGAASVGTISLDVGKTEEIGLIGGDGLEIDLQLLSETDRQPGLSIRDLDGSQVEWYPGPIMVDDSVVVDVVQASDAEVGFITSERKSYSSTVTVAYHIHSHPVDIPQPPWVTLLSEAVENFHLGQGMAMYSLLFSAFENLLSREISRTLRATGWRDNPIEDFLSRHWKWDERCKGGIQKISSKHFPTEYPTLYEDLHDLRQTRNNEIIHVDPGDSVANIGIPELEDSFKTVLDAMVAVHELCYDKRKDSLYPLGVR